jgi:hypothetical protein
LYGFRLVWAKQIQNDRYFALSRNFHSNAIRITSSTRIPRKINKNKQEAENYIQKIHLPLSMHAYIFQQPHQTATSISVLQSGRHISREQEKRQSRVSRARERVSE